MHKATDGQGVRHNFLDINQVHRSYDDRLKKLLVLTDSRVPWYDKLKRKIQETIRRYFK